MKFDNYWVLILLSLSCLIPFGLNAQNTWEQLADLPSQESNIYDPFRVGLGWANHIPSFAIGGYGYVVDWSQNGFQNRMFKYDPVNDEWTELENSAFPDGRKSLAYAISYEGFGYLTGYGDTTNNQGLWRFDPVALVWEELQECPCIGRGHPALVAVNGTIYLGLGQGTGDNLKDWWAYDIESDSWEEKTSFPSYQRHHPYFFGIGDDVYVGMGHGGLTGHEIYNDLYRYDSNLDLWSQMSSLPAEGRVAGTEFSYQGRGYILSGEGEDHIYLESAEFWEYDPVNNNWTQLISQPGTGRWAPGSFIIGDTAYYFGGQYDRGEEVTFTDSNGNTVTLGVFYDNEFWAYNFGAATSIENSDWQNKRILVSPNPTTASILIESSDMMDKIEVLTTAGIQIYVLENINSTNIELNLDGFPKGIYSCVIHSEKSIEIKRVIKN